MAGKKKKHIAGTLPLLRPDKPEGVTFKELLGLTKEKQRRSKNADPVWSRLLNDSEMLRMFMHIMFYAQFKEGKDQGTVTITNDYAWWNNRQHKERIINRLARLGVVEKLGGDRNQNGAIRLRLTDKAPTRVQHITGRKNFLQVERGEALRWMVFNAERELQFYILYALKSYEKAGQRLFRWSRTYPEMCFGLTEHKARTAWDNLGDWGLVEDPKAIPGESEVINLRRDEHLLPGGDEGPLFPTNRFRKPEPKRSKKAAKTATPERKTGDAGMTKTVTPSTRVKISDNQQLTYVDDHSDHHKAYKQSPQLAEEATTYSNKERENKGRVSIKEQKPPTTPSAPASPSNASLSPSSTIVPASTSNTPTSPSHDHPSPTAPSDHEDGGDMFFLNQPGGEQQEAALKPFTREWMNRPEEWSAFLDEKLRYLDFYKHLDEQAKQDLKKIYTRKYQWGLEENNIRAVRWKYKGEDTTWNPLFPTGAERGWLLDQYPEVICRVLRLMNRTGKWSPGLFAGVASHLFARQHADRMWAALHPVYRLLVEGDWDEEITERLEGAETADDMEEVVTLLLERQLLHHGNNALQIVIRAYQLGHEQVYNRIFTENGQAILEGLEAESEAAKVAGALQALECWILDEITADELTRRWHVAYDLDSAYRHLKRLGIDDDDFRPDDYPVLQLPSTFFDRLDITDPGLELMIDGLEEMPTEPELVQIPWLARYLPPDGLELLNELYRSWQESKFRIIWRTEEKKWEQIFPHNRGKVLPKLVHRYGYAIITQLDQQVGEDTKDLNTFGVEKYVRAIYNHAWTKLLENSFFHLYTPPGEGLISREVANAVSELRGAENAGKVMSTLHEFTDEGSLDGDCTATVDWLVQNQADDMLLVVDALVSDKKSVKKVSVKLRAHLDKVMETPALYRYWLRDLEKFKQAFATDAFREWPLTDSATCFEFPAELNLKGVLNGWEGLAGQADATSADQDAF